MSFFNKNRIDSNQQICLNSARAETFALLLTYNKVYNFMPLYSVTFNVQPFVRMPFSMRILLYEIYFFIARFSNIESAFTAFTS